MPHHHNEDAHPCTHGFTWLVPEQQGDEGQGTSDERTLQRNPPQVSAISAGCGWSHGRMALIHNLHRYCRMGTGCGEKHGKWEVPEVEREDTRLPYWLYYQLGGNLSMSPGPALSQVSS